jgi:hypothetical protein
MAKTTKKKKPNSIYSMRFTIKRLFTFLFLAGLSYGYSQSNSETSSPYSLFGLGRLNEASTGKTNALGKSGIALTSEREINSLNPAAFATIPVKSFLFDIGGKGERNNSANAGDQKVNTTLNFSNISMALGLSEKSGIGISLMPYSDVGYKLNGVTQSEEGSANQFSSVVTGSGGLNNLMVNYGYKLTPKLNVGIRGSYHFGKITEQEDVAVGTDYLVVYDESFYKGFQAGIGMQYAVTPKFTVASVVNMPTSLSGTRDRNVYRELNGEQTSIDTDSDVKLSSFKLPLEVAVGISYKMGRSFVLNADYKKSLWGTTNMTDNIGTFANQDFFGAGVEYWQNKGNHTYFDKVRLRLGANIDNGYLMVNGSRIKNYALTSGVAIPLSAYRNSFINLSYSYGQRGMVSNTLIKENYHFFTVNLSLEDIWFIKKVYE